MLIGIALLSIPMGWVAYELSWIRQRHSFIERQRERWIATRGEKDFAKYGSSLCAYETFNRAPSALWLFGENGVAFVNVFVVMDDPYATDESNVYRDGDLIRENPVYQREFVEARNMFPEAIIGVYHCNPKAELRNERFVELQSYSFRDEWGGYRLNADRPTPPPTK